MCKRNSPCKKGSHEWMCKRDSPDLKKNKKRSQHGMCKRNSPDYIYMYIYKSQHGMCKRNTHDKNEPSMGCVRETLPIKIKKATTGCVRESSLIKMKAELDV